jgi:hypothetical protein
MSTRASDIPSTPSGGNPPETDLRSVAKQVEGLLDDDGHYNPEPDQVSRAHPDYDESTDDRAQPRDEKSGRFARKGGDDAADDGAQAAADTEITDDADAGEVDDEQLEAADTTDTDDAAADKSGASDDATTDDQATDDQGAISNLAELAEALDVSIDDIKSSISHTFRAADEDVTVTLAELEKGYQKDADYRRSTAQLSDYRREIETDMQTRHQAYEGQQHVVAQQLSYAEQIVMADLNSPQLAALRDSAPDEWVARRTEIGEKLAGLQNTRQQAAAAFEQFRVGNLNQLRAREMKTLKEAIPDFGAQHITLAKEVISSLGYSPKEAAQILDSRQICAALELGALRTRNAELEAIQTKATETVQRIKKTIPKLQKPGKQLSPGGRSKSLSRDKVQKLRTRLRKSGKLDDAAAVIETMM